MRALYVSQNGMAENLGQSQVLPYLRGLVRRGVEIDLLSYELSTTSQETRDELAQAMARDGIRWFGLERTLRAPLALKVLEAARGCSRALKDVLTRRYDIVHGRSYFATAICDALGQVSRRSKLLFDCRGMIGDEYVDCGYWTTDRVEYRLVKAYERRLFARADGIVVLTRALAGWTRETGLLGARPVLEVVPCCVDMARFVPSDDARRRLRQEFGLGDRLVLVYAGSLGTWYLEPEMARFAGAFRARAEARGQKVSFVCFTPSDASGLVALLGARGFAPEEIVVRRVKPADMPAHLAVGDVGISFIQSCFSKKGSSPTKVAEYLASGSAVVLNGDIGDQADLANERDACVVLPDFTDASIDRAAAGALDLVLADRASRVDACVAVARRHFGLEEVGIARYARLYEALAARA